MKQTVVLAALLFCSVAELCVGVTVMCYMEPNRVLPTNIQTRVTGTVTLSQQYIAYEHRRLKAPLHSAACLATLENAPVVQVAESPGNGTKITVSLKGLTLHTVHGFHVHKYGDILSNGCQSCGSHYNPFGALHGGPRDSNRHVGDLGNVMSNGDGKIETEFYDYLVSLYQPNSVIGRSLVLHAKRDDLGRGTGAARQESLKTGNAGARLACCTIVYAAPPTPPT